MLLSLALPRVSLARHRDVGTQHLKTTPTASEKRGWVTVGSMCPKCRDAAAGWARAASGAGNRWAAVAAAVRRRGSGRSLGGRSLWSVAEAGSVAEAWLLAAEAESVWRWHAGDAGAAGANAG